MKRVAIVSGLGRPGKYCAALGNKYKESSLKLEPTQFKFNRALLFCCHLHGALESQVKKIVHENDVIHLQSGGFFPVIPYMVKHNIRKPIILEAPVLKSHTGTLLAAVNLSKNYDVPQSRPIQLVLDNLCFTPQWKEMVLEQVRALGHEDTIIYLYLYESLSEYIYQFIDQSINQSIYLYLSTYRCVPSPPPARPWPWPPRSTG